MFGIFSHGREEICLWLLETCVFIVKDIDSIVYSQTDQAAMPISRGGISGNLLIFFSIIDL